MNRVKRLARKPLAYALLALVISLPGFAIAGGGSKPPAQLSVSASLGGCGLAGSAIMCQIDASWNQIPDADSYTASVTAADGTVTDAGQVSGGGTTIYVPYTGDGTYSVEVTAWGEPKDSSTHRTLIARATSSPSQIKSTPAASSASHQRDKSEPKKSSPSNPGDPSAAVTDAQTGQAAPPDASDDSADQDTPPAETCPDPTDETTTTDDSTTDPAAATADATADPATAAPDAAAAAPSTDPPSDVATDPNCSK